MRQQGEDNIAVRFRAALGELQSATLSQASWELLCTRTANQLSSDEVNGFNKAYGSIIQPRKYVRQTITV